VLKLSPNLLPKARPPNSLVSLASRASPAVYLPSLSSNLNSNLRLQLVVAFSTSLHNLRTNQEIRYLDRLRLRIRSNRQAASSLNSSNPGASKHQASLVQLLQADSSLKIQASQPAKLLFLALNRASQHSSLREASSAHRARELESSRSRLPGASSVLRRRSHLLRRACSAPKVSPNSSPSSRCRLSREVSLRSQRRRLRVCLGQDLPNRSLHLGCSRRQQPRRSRCQAKRTRSSAHPPSSSHSRQLRSSAPPPLLPLRRAACLGHRLSSPCSSSSSSRPSSRSSSTR